MVNLESGDRSSREVHPFVISQHNYDHYKAVADKNHIQLVAVGTGDPRHFNFQTNLPQYGPALHGYVLISVQLQKNALQHFFDLVKAKGR